METAVKLQNVCASYDGKYALEDISLSIPRNRITAILGPSGCGNSTLLRVINRMLEDESGTAVLGDILLGSSNTRSIAVEELRRRVGLVFQTPTRSAQRR